MDVLKKEMEWADRNKNKNNANGFKIFYFRVNPSVPSLAVGALIAVYCS